MRVFHGLLLPTTVVVIIGICSVAQTNGLNTTDCMESQICYHCDSSQDSYCGNPFQYSHYYRSTHDYLIQCEGCCIKIVHPKGNGTRRIERSCTDLLPELEVGSLELEEDCDASDSGRQVCICKRALCNGYGLGAATSNLLMIVSLSVLHIFSQIRSVVVKE